MMVTVLDSSVQKSVMRLTSLSLGKEYLFDCPSILEEAKAFWDMVLR